MSTEGDSDSLKERAIDRKLSWKEMDFWIVQLKALYAKNLSWKLVLPIPWKHFYSINVVLSEK